jgi:predicted hotdog family 3-hydroxylacyl-ACP dehydratase
MTSLDRQQIARIIPHGGTMVLIDEVIHWDEHRLLARTESHLRADNPLRDERGLHIACGIEYAAQAMALHGVVRGVRPGEGRPGRPRAGLLASLREVRFLAHRLDEDSTVLLIEADLVSGDLQVAMYEFAVRSPARALLTGRATVVLDALNLLDPPSGAGPAAEAGAG